MAVLKLEKDDDRHEIDFELDYLASLTTRQRFEMMAQKSLDNDIIAETKWTQKIYSSY